MGLCALFFVLRALFFVLCSALFQFALLQTIKAPGTKTKYKTQMLNNVLGRIWRKLPSSVRRLALRVTNTKFTVTAAAIIFNEDHEVLLLKHRFRPGSGWGLPGGFLKPGEQPLNALQRELQEEIALQIHQVEIFWARSFERPQQVEVVFRAKALNEPVLQSIEIESVRWFRSDNLPEGLPRDQKLLVERAVEKRWV
jgi:8-oxo-dGTP diphosphatase